MMLQHQFSLGRVVSFCAAYKGILIPVASGLISYMLGSVSIGETIQAGGVIPPKIDFLSLHSQIVQCPTLFHKLENYQLCDFNVVAAKHLLQNSNLQESHQAYLVVKYFMSEGVRFILDTNGNQISISMDGIR